MSKSFVRGVAILSIPVLIGILAWAKIENWTIWGDKKLIPNTSDSAIKVALAEVISSEIPRYYSSVGTLEATQQVQVTTEVSGRVAALHFDSGQHVKAGQLLIKLNDAPQRAQSQRLRALLKNEELRLRRVQRLAPSGAVSQEKVDQITTNRDAIRNELHEVDAEIARRNIQAPFTGELGIRRVHLGQYLSPGDPITNLSDNSHLRVNFSLDEQAYASLSLGQAVKLRFHSQPETLFEAHVTAIDPVLDNSRMVLVQATLTETGNKQLVAGMFAEVKVLRQSHGAALSVPQTAVVATSYGDTVFVAIQGLSGLKVKRVSVRTGQAYNNRLEILEGLNKNDRVVVSGQTKLSDGARVEVLPEDTLGNSSREQSLLP